MVDGGQRLRLGLRLMCWRVQRGVFVESHVGFHSAYNGETKAIENGSANAVIGAYVARLGFGYDVVGYVTSAKPDNMDWLDAEKAKKYSIAFTYLGSMEPNKKQSQSQVQPQPKKYGVNEAPPAQSLDLIPYVEGNKNFSISLPFFLISFTLGAPRRYASAPASHCRSYWRRVGPRPRGRRHRPHRHRVECSGPKHMTRATMIVAGALSPPPLPGPELTCQAPIILVGTQIRTRTTQPLAFTSSVRKKTVGDHYRMGNGLDSPLYSVRNSRYF
jgi:hypothetical protein